MRHTHHALQGPGNVLEEEEVCKSGKGMGETCVLLTFKIPRVSKPEPRLFRSALRPDPGNNFWTPWSALSATLMSSDFVLCLDNSVGRIPVTLCLWKHASCPPRAPRLWMIKVTPDSGFYLPTEDFCGLCPHWPSLSLSAYRRLLFAAFHQTALLDQDAAAFVALCPPRLCNWLFTI